MQIKPQTWFSIVNNRNFDKIHPQNIQIFISWWTDIFRNILRYMLSKYKLSQIIISTHCLSYIIQASFKLSLSFASVLGTFVTISTFSLQLCSEPQSPLSLLKVGTFKRFLPTQAQPMLAETPTQYSQLPPIKMGPNPAQLTSSKLSKALRSKFLAAYADQLDPNCPKIVFTESPEILSLVASNNRVQALLMSK